MGDMIEIAKHEAQNLGIADVGKVNYGTRKEGDIN
jgi:hypothetical protein